MANPVAELQPRLDIPAEVEAWINALRAQGIPELEIIQQLEQYGSPEALLRCARLHLTRRQHSQARKYAMDCRHSDRQDVRLYAEAILAVCDTVTERIVHPKPTGMTAHNQIAVLCRVLNKIRESHLRTLLLDEAEMRVWMFLCLAHQNAGDYKAALDAARTAKHLAGSLGLPQSVNACVNLISCQLSLLGSLQEAHGELLAALERGAVSHLQSDYHRQVAEILFVGGHFETVRDILQGIGDLDQNASWNQVYLLLYGMLEGVLMEGEVSPDERLGNLIRPIVESLKCILKAESLARTNEHVQERLALYRRAVACVATQRYERERYLSLVATWLRAYCSLRQGHGFESLREIERCSSIPPEWLNLRALVFGLKLELALHWSTSPFVSLHHCENELREVWKLAHRLSFGHPQGLAGRQIRWHPLAAAYMAVHPEPIFELEIAKDMLITFQSRPMVYGFELEPAYANELVLRSLNVDLLPPPFIQATRNSRIRAQIDRFHKDYGEAVWWRPSVSIVPLIYGLVMSNHSRRFDQATALMEQYGVFAESKASGHLSILRRLTRAVQSLAEQPISRQAFLESLPKLLR